MAKHLIEVADYHKVRGVVVLTEEGGNVVVRQGPEGVEIEADPPGLRDLARWCLALADPAAPSGAHVHLDAGTMPLTHDSASLMLGRWDDLAAD